MKKIRLIIRMILSFLTSESFESFIFAFFLMSRRKKPIVRTIRKIIRMEKYSGTAPERKIRDWALIIWPVLANERRDAR